MSFNSIAWTAAAACALVLTSSPLMAQATASAEAGPSSSHDIRDAMLANPGSRQVSADTIELRPGVTMSITSERSESGVCPEEFLCLFQHANFHSDWDTPWRSVRLAFTRCQVENLGNYKMPDGRPWNDQVSSIDNAQIGGVQSKFYNYKGSGNPYDLNNSNPVTVLNAGHYLRDLSKDSSWEGGTANDKIDLVKVC
jgi:hypothetical protein